MGGPTTGRWNVATHGADNCRKLRDLATIPVDAKKSLNPVEDSDIQPTVSNQHWLSKEDRMKRHLSGVLLCAALLIPAVLPGRATAADKETNKFSEVKKHDLELSGTITAMHTNGVTIKLEGTGKKTFTVAKDCMFFVKHKEGAAALTDFKIGEKVNVLYKQVGPALVCDSMWQTGSLPTEKERKIEGKPPAQ